MTIVAYLLMAGANLLGKQKLHPDILKLLSEYKREGKLLIAERWPETRELLVLYPPKIPDTKKCASTSSNNS